MVADDDVNALLASVSDLPVGLDAAVQNNHRTAALRAGMVDALHGNAVAFGLPVGHIGMHFARCLLFQVRSHQGNRSSAVHIVVAVHHDGLFTRDCLLDAFNSAFHAFHLPGIVELAE